MKMKKALIYARYSSLNQREESIDAQLRAVHEYATKNDIEILRTYADEAQSGKNDQRDEFQQMIEAIMLGDVQIDMILVHKFNRFARDTFDSAIYKRKLKDIGVRVVSVTQPIDDSPEGAMLERFLEAIDEYYSANLALEVKKGLRENALKGQKVGGKIPLGYDMGEDGFYTVNEEEAALVRRIFDDFANGISKSKICYSLNCEGFKSKQGGFFRITTIADMLKNEKYIGIFKYKISKQETITVDNVVPAIIEKDVWRVVQDKMKTRTKPRQNKVNHYALTGKAFCLSCGSSISGVGGGKKLKSGERLWYYECTGKTSQKNGCTSRKINKKWIENAIVSEILKAAFDENTLTKIASLAFAEIQKTASQPVRNIDKVRRQLKENAEEQLQLARLFMKSKLTMSILEAEEERLADEKFELERKLDHFNSISAAAGITESDVLDFIKSYVNKIIKSPDVASQRLVSYLISSFLHKVKIDNDTVEIQLVLDFFSLRFDGCGNERFAGAIRSLSQLTKSSTLQRCSISSYDLDTILTEI